MAPRPTSIAIVIGDFHQDIAETMIAAAEAEAHSAGINTIKIIRVAGSYELPLVIDTMLNQGVDAAVALGYIERGETLHGEVMGHVVHQALIDLQLKHRKPIGLGIIGPGATDTQAHARKEKNARGAVQAMLRSYATLQQLVTTPVS